jgi:DNA-binding XRE family transcriptional regulator
MNWLRFFTALLLAPLAALHASRSSMPTAPYNHDAHDYVERSRERLPRRLQELQETARLSMYDLWRKCSVSRDTISRIETGDAIPGVHVLARLAWGVGKTISDFFGGIEDE